ncbi:GNAT family N-acetyltransferase [Streptomyces sp. RS10V-4]|uniref:GNAT family N-acetyltransferase n=1 Tax=Streptomyces rhizoryzae TaxID=2932493 RepID=UPI002004628B|nr:GNAT family N-acetyltransferase [Streptomyces rhizoryzae]MCK7622179.1 GNAT family N-acetyltransferase [Streptomyces rhizoryzae]
MTDQDFRAHPGIRAVAEDDWDGITALESRAYAALGLSEEPAALRSRARSSPATCFVLDVRGRLAGYLLALPYPPYRYPDLTRAEADRAAAAPTRNLHLHDLVVDGPCRGRGLGGQLLRHLMATAAATGGYDRLSLVAVAGSRTFWAAHGFTAHPGVVPAGAYGPDAVYMTRPLPPHHRAGAPRPAAPGTP